MDEQVRIVVSQLLDIGNPTRALLLDVERLGAAGVEAICQLLRDEPLSPSQQSRALQGLGYAAKHAGSREQLLVLEAALGRSRASDISLRSRAVHMAVTTLAIIRRRASQANDNEIRERVVTAAREALSLGLHVSSERVVRDFLKEDARH
jgi:hypothetical protein